MRTEALKDIQDTLAKRVFIKPLDRLPSTVAGVDVAYREGRARGAAVLFSYPDKKPLASGVAEMPVRFPYVPGFLSFREIPAIIGALRSLGKRPDLVLVDGQGIAHPRGLGLASHLGVLLGLATVGCAKSRLVGQGKEPGSRKGDRTPLFYRGKTVGVILRTRDGTRPVFVSPGHLVSVADAARFVLEFCTRYRLPEPIRMADRLSKGL